MATQTERLVANVLANVNDRRGRKLLAAWNSVDRTISDELWTLAQILAHLLHTAPDDDMRVETRAVFDELVSARLAMLAEGMETVGNA